MCSDVLLRHRMYRQKLTQTCSSEFKLVTPLNRVLYSIRFFFRKGSYQLPSVQFCIYLQCEKKLLLNSWILVISLNYNKAATVQVLLLWVVSSKLFQQEEIKMLVFLLRSSQQPVVRILYSSLTQTYVRHMATGATHYGH